MPATVDDAAILFAIVKHDLLDVVSRHGWEAIECVFREHSCRTLWRLERPVPLTLSFWREHYAPTLDRKDLKWKGNGQRYLNKILSRLEDFDGVPLLLEAKGSRWDADATRVLKTSLRKAFGRTYPDDIGRSVSKEKVQLLHVCDTVADAQREAANLVAYLTEAPPHGSACYRQMAADEAAVFRSRVASDIVPRLRVFLDAAEGGQTNEMVVRMRQSLAAS